MHILICQPQLPIAEYMPISMLAYAHSSMTRRQLFMLFSLVILQQKQQQAVSLMSLRHIPPYVILNNPRKSKNIQSPSYHYLHLRHKSKAPTYSLHSIDTDRNSISHRDRIRCLNRRHKMLSLPENQPKTNRNELKTEGNQTSRKVLKTIHSGIHNVPRNRMCTINDIANISNSEQVVKRCFKKQKENNIQKQNIESEYKKLTLDVPRPSRKTKNQPKQLSNDKSMFQVYLKNIQKHRSRQLKISITKKQRPNLNLQKVQAVHKKSHLKYQQSSKDNLIGAISPKLEIDCSQIQRINQSSFISEVGKKGILQNLKINKENILDISAGVKKGRCTQRKRLRKMLIFPSDFF